MNEADHSIRAQLDALDKRFGRGQTFDIGTRRLILDGVVPLRVAMGCRLLKGETRETYEKAFRRLVEMEKEFGAEIDGGRIG